MSPTASAARRPFHPPPLIPSLFPHHPGSLLSVQDLTLESLNHILTRATALTNQDPLTRDRILAKRRQIAFIWSIGDVQQVRPDLTDVQAWEVLQEVERIHDAEIGINWECIEIVAADLFPSTNSEKE